MRLATEAAPWDRKWSQLLSENKAAPLHFFVQNWSQLWGHNMVPVLGSLFHFQKGWAQNWGRHTAPKLEPKSEPAVDKNVKHSVRKNEPGVQEMWPGAC